MNTEERKALFDEGLCEECKAVKKNRTWLLCNDCNDKKYPASAPAGMAPGMAHHGKEST